MCFLVHIALLLLLPIPCNGITPLILSGEKAPDGAYPFVVQLCHHGFKTAFCTGTLISDRHVLTAAHCISHLHTPDHEKFVIEDVKIMVGSDISLCSQKRIKRRYRYGVARGIPHPNYDHKTLLNDIAIITLNRNASLQIRHKLPFDDEKFRIRARARVFGWGMTCSQHEAQTHGHGHAGAQHLYMHHIVWLAQETCKQRYDDCGLRSDSADMTFCGGSPCGGTWHGDSGGPVLVRDRVTDTDYVVGVTSFGLNPPEYSQFSVDHDQIDLPTTYTRVSRYCDFIREATDGEAICAAECVRWSLFVVFIVALLTV